MRSPNSDLFAQAIRTSENRRRNESIILAAVFFIVVILAAVIVDSGPSNKVWCAFLFFVPGLLFAIRAWRHRRPELHPLVSVIAKRPDSIVRVFVRNTKWKTRYGTTLSEEEHLVFLDDRGKRYTIRVDQIFSATILRQLGSLFPRATLGYESD
jgi:hypothetical protein